MIERIEETLRDHPDDWSAWLAHAGRLVEQGDARAELIRLEHRRVVEGARAAPALSQQIAALQEKHRARWGLDLPEGATPTWRNGFIVHLEVPLGEETAGELAPILAHPNARLLTSLQLTPERSEDEEELEDMDEADFRKPPRPRDAGAACAVLALELGRIRALSFAYAVIGAKGARALAGAPLPALTSLDLRYAWIGSDGLAALACSDNLARVASLSLQRNGLREKGVRALVESPRLGRLRRLDLRYNPLRAAGARAIAGAASLAGLERLLLYRADVGKGGAQALAASPHLPAAITRLWRAS